MIAIILVILAAMAEFFYRWKFAESRIMYVLAAALFGIAVLAVIATLYTPEDCIPVILGSIATVGVISQISSAESFAYETVIDRLRELSS